MGEREALGVQELALEAMAGLSVLGVAEHRMADRQQVRADLMRAPGLQPDAQQRAVRQRALDLEVRDGRLGLVGVAGDPRAHAAVAAERRVDRPLARRRAALDEREVLAGDRPGAHLRPQRVIGLHGAGDEQQARRVAVQAVDDACAVGVLPALGQPAQGLRQRAGAVAAGRVHDDARGLVDHQQVLVGPGDLVRRLGGLGLRLGGQLAYLDALAPLQDVALGLRLAVDRDRAGVDQPLRGRARAGVRREEDVEAPAGRFGSDDHPASAASRSRARGGPSST